MKTSYLTMLLGAVAATGISHHGASVTQDWLASPNQSNTAADTWQFFNNISGVQLEGVRDGSYPHLARYTTAYPEHGLESWEQGFEIVGKNTSGASVDRGGVDWPVDQVFMHPAEDSSLGVGIGHLVPATGYYDISGYLQPLHHGGVNWYLDVNDVNVALGDTLDLARDDFDLANIALNAGDMVYLIIGNGGSFFGDTTGVDFVITPSSSSVPDSGSTAFALMGALGAAGLFRRISRNG